MSSRQERIEIFEGTRQLCLSTPFLKNAITASQKNQRIYWEGDSIEYSHPRFPMPAKMILSPKKTVEAAHSYAASGKKVCILNFASSVAPGGGVLTGEQAQEESICRVSTLYFALSDSETAGKFYNYHWELIRAGKMNRRNRDDIVYTPGVVAVRDDANGEAMLAEKDWYEMDVITCAAPDLRQLGDAAQFSPTMEELRVLHEIRWRCILAAAAKHEADVLILGAFGCGVFANPPELVVEAFNNVLPEFRNHFEAIEFAVYATRMDTPNYQAFRGIRDVQERN
ncbi:MAG: TIGR02452 family protein [Ruminococcaceae bacterium]|nr:TIGR02452 family protein [Oscillospiraceae bacterium]